MSTESHETHGVAHIMPLKILLGVFLALVVLTVVTVAASNPELHLGSYALVVAIAIAVVKASLVVLYFMHLRYDNPFNAIVFVGCLIFVALFMFLSLTDTTAYHPSVLRGQAGSVKAPDLDKIEKHEGEHAPE